MSGVASIFVASCLLVMPTRTALYVANVSIHASDIHAMALRDFGIQLGLSAGIWALLVSCAWGMKRRRIEGKNATIRKSAGTAITETLIILPPFFLLLFGLSQLCINNIAQMLANVAVYQAARSSWIWYPEQSRGGGPDQAKKRAQIAAAVVMTPVANGDMFGIASLGTEASKMREAIAFSQTGGISLGGLGNLAVTLGSIGTETETGMDKALDKSPFALRSVRKFSHAVAATQIEARADGAKLTYSHYQAMPMMGRVFTGTPSWNPLPGNAIVGLRPGFYIKIERNLTITAQGAAPNASNPYSDFLTSESSDGSSSAVGGAFPW